MGYHALFFVLFVSPFYFFSSIIFFLSFVFFLLSFFFFSLFFSFSQYNLFFANLPCAKQLEGKTLLKGKNQKQSSYRVTKFGLYFNVRKLIQKHYYKATVALGKKS